MIHSAGCIQLWIPVSLLLVQTVTAHPSLRHLFLVKIRCVCLQRKKRLWSYRCSRRHRWRAPDTWSARTWFQPSLFLSNQRRGYQKRVSQGDVPCQVLDYVLSFANNNNNNTNNNKRICIAQVCRMTSEALDGQLQSCYTAKARSKCLTEEKCFKTTLEKS